MEELTHLDELERAAMVDVSRKSPQLRRARAAGRIRLAPETVSLVAANGIRKGNVLAIAEIAGIQAAKRTDELIPLCHPLPLTRVAVQATLEPDGIMVESEVACVGVTGVEMEALTAVSVALITVYDMCKAVDKGMVLEQIMLLEKTKEDLA